MPTDTLTTTFNGIAEQVLGGVTVAQDAVIAVVDSIADTIKPLTDAVPADVRPDVKATVEAAFGFAEKLLANQKAFALKLAESAS